MSQDAEFVDLCTRAINLGYTIVEVAPGVVKMSCRHVHLGQMTRAEAMTVVEALERGRTSGANFTDDHGLDRALDAYEDRITSTGGH